jgi:hypothetical protein
VATAVKGAVELRKALRKFEPDLSKELQKEMASALKPIVVKARGYIKTESPLSGWKPRSFSEARFPFYDAPLMRRGISYRTTPTKPNRKGWVYAASVFNKTASGAIFETAGRKNPNGQDVGPFGRAETRKRFNRSNNPRAGKSFIAGLESASPMKQGSTSSTRPGSGSRGRYMKGRAIFRAWAEDNGKVTGAVMKALDTSAMNFRKKVGKF